MKEQDRIFKHLEFLQAAIHRKAQNSFAYKGWALTIVSASLAFSAENHEGYWIAVFPIMVFWWLDAYSLRCERLFRRLYDTVRTQRDTDFSMDIKPFSRNVPSLVCTFFSGILSCLYGSMLFIIVLATLFN